MLATTLGGVAALAAMLTSAAPSTAVEACEKMIRKHPAHVRVDSATIGGDKRTLRVKVTYQCREATHLAVAAGQPPAANGGAPRYQRIGAATAPARCDGKRHTGTLTAKPQAGFAKVWQRGAPATVGATLQTAKGNCLYTLAKSSKSLRLK
ncbi:hypothetical protein ACSNOI_14255 [Actinomadura kijaniata]|uniref:hypothetical protein n=1 Tax=Actinomadura kijaniata TaxID=46161 RepID=UPI003F1A205A